MLLRFNIALTLIIFILAAVTGILYTKVKRLERNQLTFTPGETLPGLELLNLDNFPLRHRNVIIRRLPSYLFLKPRVLPVTLICRPGTKIAKYFGNRINIMGIIPDGDPAAFQLMDEKKVRFSLYAPADEGRIAEKDAF